MKNTDAKWAFYRNSVFPIMNVKGECKWAESKNSMIMFAASIVDMASQFDGLPRSEFSHEPSKSTITVELSLVFPSEAQFANFKNFIEARFH